MGNIIDTISGNSADKKAYKKNEARAKALPDVYAKAYSDIKKYIFRTSGLLMMKPLEVLVDILEDAAIRNKPVLEVTGEDVAGFADELVREEASYQENERKKLNETILKKTK